MNNKPILFAIMMIFFLCAVNTISASNDVISTIDQLKIEHDEIIYAINNINIEKTGAWNKGVLRSYSSYLKPIHFEPETAILRRYEEILAERGWLKYEVKMPQKTITFCKNRHNMIEISFSLYKKTGTYYFAVAWYKDTEHMIPCKLEPGATIVKGITNDDSFNSLLVLFLLIFIVVIIIYANRKKLQNIKWSEK